MDSKKKGKVSKVSASSKRSRQVHDSCRTENVKKAKFDKSSDEVDLFDLSMFSEKDIRGLHVQVVSQCREIVALVNKLSDEQKVAVSEIGFGSLLKLTVTDFSNEFYVPFLLNYNGGAMTFSNGKESVLINSATISKVLGLPYTNQDVEIEEVRKRDGRSSERQFWYDFLGVNASKPYLRSDLWGKLFEKYNSGDEFKQLFVFFCMTFFLCPRSDFAPHVNCGRSLRNVCDIAKYNWSGYVTHHMSAGVRSFHQTLLKKKEEGILGGKAVKIKVTGCIFALVLAVLHKFKVRDMDYSRVSSPYIGFWTDENLAKVVKVYGQNLKHAIVVPEASNNEEEPNAFQGTTGGCQLTSRKGVSRHTSSKDVFSKNAVLEEGSSGRELVLKLPPHLKTDEEIDALDIPEYSKKIMKVQRNTIAMCEVNIEIANAVTAQGHQLSQDSMSQDDNNDLELNEQFFKQMDEICTQYFANKELAKSLNVSESPVVKKKVSFDTDTNETVIFEKDGILIGSSYSEENVNDGDVDNNADNDDDDEDHENNEIVHDEDLKKNDDGDSGDSIDNKDTNVGGDQTNDEDDKGDKDADQGINVNSCRALIVSPQVQGTSSSAPHERSEGIHHTYSRRTTKDLCSKIFRTVSDRLSNPPKSSPPLSNRDSSMPSFQLLTPSPLLSVPATPPGVSVDGSVFSLSDVLDKIKDPKYRTWVDSGDDAGVCSPPSVKSLLPNDPDTPELLKGWDYDDKKEPSVPRLDSTPRKTCDFVDLVSDNEELEALDDEKVAEIINDIQVSIFEKMEKKKRKQEPDEEECMKIELDNISKFEVSNASASDGTGAHEFRSYTHSNELPMWNNDVILSRSLQVKPNDYLDNLSPSELALVDFLFFSPYLEECEYVVDMDDDEVEERNRVLQDKLEDSVLVFYEGAGSDSPVIQLAKFDLLSLAPRSWLSSSVIDAAAYFFNRKEEEQMGTPRRFWFSTIPYNYINQLEDQRAEMKFIEQELAQYEFDLQNAQDTVEYESLLSKCEARTARLNKLDFKRPVENCRIALSHWAKLFSNKSLRNVQLIFVPVFKDNHFTVLVFNFAKRFIEDIENRSDHKHFERYGAALNDFCNVLEDFLSGSRICRTDCHRLRNWEKRTIPFPWRNNKNSTDCGVYVVKAMEWYNGGNEKEEPIKSLHFAGVKNLARCKLAVEFVNSDLNHYKGKTLTACAKWSQKKPELSLKQKQRKAFEKEINSLRLKEAKKKEEEDKRAQRERALQEKKKKVLADESNDCDKNSE